MELPCNNLPFLKVAVRYVISGLIRVLVLLWRGCLPGHDGGSLGWLVLAFRWHWRWVSTIPTCPQADHGIQVAEPAKCSNYIIRACTVPNAGNLTFWLRFIVIFVSPTIITIRERRMAVSLKHCPYLRVLIILSFIWCFLISALVKVKVKQSRHRPGVAQRVPGGLGSQISWHSAREGGEVVSLTHRPSLPPRNVPGTHFH